MSSRSVIIVIIAALVLPVALPAVASMEDAYQLGIGGLTENFNSMGSSSTSTKAPGASSTTTYWYIYSKDTEFATNLDVATYDSAIVKSGYNAGTSGGTDRALTIYADGGADKRYMRAKFQNTTGADILSITQGCRCRY